MEYVEFENAIIQYNDLYRQGLKKQANEYISNVLNKANTLDESVKYSIFRRFVSIFR